MKLKHTLTSFVVACSLFMVPMFSYAETTKGDSIIFSTVSSGTIPNAGEGPMPVHDVFAWNLAGKTQLTNMQSNSSNGEISPDGTKLIFNSWDFVDNQPYTYVQNIDGTNVKKLTKVSDASWTPDGKIVGVYGFYEPTYDVYSNDIVLVDSENLSETRIKLEVEGNERYPQVTADGEKVIFVGGEGLKSVNIDGTDLQNIPNGEKTYYFDYAAETNQLLFQNEQGVHIAKLDGSIQHTFTLNKSENEGLSGIVLSPDAKEIACSLYNYETKRAKLLIMNKDGSNLEEVLTETNPIYLSDWAEIR